MLDPVLWGGVRCSCVELRCFFFQAEDGIRDLVRSRGLGDVYKRQIRRSRLKKSTLFEMEYSPELEAVQKEYMRLAASLLSLIHI